MQNHVILRKENHIWSVQFAKKFFNFVPADFLSILTKKHKKDLQLIWPLKYDTVFRN